MTQVLARSTDPETSHEAAADLDLNGSEAFVLEVLREFGPMADFELCNRAHWYAGRNGLTQYTDQRIRTARACLERDGLVCFTGGYRYRKGSTRRHRVHEVVGS